MGARRYVLTTLLGALLAIGSLIGSRGMSRGQSLLAPRPKQDFTARLPVFEQAALANGLTIYTYEDDSLPLVTVTLSLRTGSAHEPANRGGLAQIAYELLADRAGLASSDASAPAVADLGTELVTRVETDGSQLQLRVVAAQAERAVAALAGLVHPGKVDAQYLTRFKTRHIGERNARLGWPQISAEEQLRRLIYGEGHPYGHTPAGTAETVNAITPEDVATYYGCALYPQNAALIITGRITTAAAQKWANQYLGSWQAPVRVCQAAADPPTATKRTTVVAIAKPGLVQSVIAIGRAMLPLNHKDTVALHFAAAHLGAKTFHQLRNKQGISYGVSSELTQNLYGGHYRLSTSVQADQTGAALSDILSQIFAIQSDSVSTQLVIHARVGMSWELVSHYDTLGDSAARVGWLFQEHQPLLWDQQMLERLRQVGPSETDVATSRYFNRDLMQIVVVGDPEVIRRQVEPLKLGTLRWVEPGGNLRDAL